MVILESLWIRIAPFNLLLNGDWDQGIDRILAPRAAWLHGFRILLCLGMCFLVGLSDCLRSLGIDRLVSVPLALRSRLRRRLRWVTWLACLYIISYCIVSRFSCSLVQEIGSYLYLCFCFKIRVREMASIILQEEIVCKIIVFRLVS